MLKKIMVFALMATLFAGVAQARHHGGGFMGGETPQPTQTGGFKGPGVALGTVQGLADMKDDSQVHLKGHIEKSLGDEKYMFRDSTGTFVVEIDDKRWHGQTVTPQDTVEIYGELDKELIGQSEIDVKRIILVK